MTCSCKQVRRKYYKSCYRRPRIVRSVATHRGLCTNSTTSNFPMASGTEMSNWMVKNLRHQGRRKYLNISITADGQQPQIREGSFDRAEEDTRTLVTSGFCTITVKACQIGPVFNAILISKRRYDLIFLFRSGKLSRYTKGGADVAVWSKLRANI